MAQELSKENGTVVTEKEIEQALINELAQSMNLTEVLDKIEVEIYKHSRIKYDECIATCSTNDLSCLSSCFDFYPQSMMTQEDLREDEQNYRWKLRLINEEEEESGECVQMCFNDYKNY